MELVLAALPLLAFLACPLMMLVCVVGIRRMGCGTPQANPAPPPTGTREERAAALQQQLRAVQAELSALQQAEAGVVGRDDRPASVPHGTAHAARRPA